jgi:hypothetical protein
VRGPNRRIEVVLGAGAAAAAIGAAVEAHRVGLDVRYGAAMAAGFVVAALVALGSVVAVRPALFLALGLAVVPSVSGHALDPGVPAVNVAFDVAHVLAAAAWVGVLIGIALSGREARRATVLAAAGVVLLGVSGALRAGFELTAASQLWTTSYGKALLVKTAIVLGALGIGWLLRRGPRRRAVLEAAFVVAIVGVAAVLVQLRPGRNAVPVAAPVVALTRTPEPPPPPPGAVVLAQPVETLGVALEAEPGRTRVVVLSPAGGGLSGLQVQLAGVVASPCGSGCYAAALPVHGRVRVSIQGFGAEKVASFDLPASAPSATATLRRFQRTYRALAGVTYTEHLASSPAHAIDSRWRMERPDRMSYVLAGGGGGIVIGTARWDQNTTRAPWVRSSQTPALHQPSTLWEHATNAHLLSVNGRWETISFADPELPAFFTATIDRRTLRPRVVHMIASAHFMTDRYSSFSPAREIRAPRRAGA